MNITIGEEKACCDTDDKKYDLGDLYKPGYATEYTDNFVWGAYLKHKQAQQQVNCDLNCDTLKRNVSALYDGKTFVQKNCYEQNAPACDDVTDEGDKTAIDVEASGRNLEFVSDVHDSLWRSSRLKRDKNGEYVDPFRNLITTNSGRRLMYDPTHPDMIFPSQHSSELADTPHVYSFKTPIQQQPEIPWVKDISWKAESQTGNWPTNMWKTWESVAGSPVYDGHDDQCRYSKFKVPIL